jgi:hypothetical protein
MNQIYSRDADIIGTRGVKAGDNMRNVLYFIRMQMNRFLKPTAIHAESIHIDRVWEKAKQYAGHKKATWFVFTPENFKLVKETLGFKGSKKEYERILIKRYRWLKNHGQRIQLHVHLRYFPDTMKESDINKKINKSFKWLAKNEFLPTEVVFGWWIWPKCAEVLANKLGLKVVKYFDYYWFHDYDFAGELIQR